MLSVQNLFLKSYLVIISAIYNKGTLKRAKAKDEIKSIKETHQNYMSLIKYLSSICGTVIRGDFGLPE